MKHKNLIAIGPEGTPVESFTGDDNSLRSISIVTGIDVVGTNLSVDKMTPLVEYPYTVDSAELVAPIDHIGVRTTDGFLLATNRRFINLQRLPYGTPIRYYRRGKLEQKMYLKSVDRMTRCGFKLNSMSAIGLLDTQKHRGGIYTGQPFEEVLAEIIDGAISYTMAGDVKDLSVYGWLPYSTKRENLHQLLFSCGVMCGKNEAGDPDFHFLHSTEPLEVPDGRFYTGGNVDYSAPASAVDVTEHAFIALDTDETVIVYDNTDGSETADHTFLNFGSNAPLHDLETTGTLAINESGVNWAIVTGAGKLTGKKYTHSTRVMRRYADDAGNQEENVASVSNCTLINVANSVNLAARVLAYYNSRKTIAASIVLNGEKAGDYIKTNDPYDEPITGYIATMEVTVSATNKANCRIITGYIPRSVGNNYRRSITLTGTGQIDLTELVADKEDKHVQITLLGGGHGGGSGNPGENGGRASTTSYGTGGEGGAPGIPGTGGDVVTVTLDLTGHESYVVDFSCGEGGESDQHGGATTLGDYSSDAGAPSANGVTDIFTGKTYGRAGSASGIAGAKGSGNIGTGPNLVFEGVTYRPGANGGAVDGYIEGKAYGGLGGGAAAGANGGDGQNGYTWENNGHGFNQGGLGGAGATPVARTAASGYGQGGDAGHGGGGGGGGGPATGSTHYTWPNDGGPGGSGGLGGKGGPGLIIIYF